MFNQADRRRAELAKIHVAKKQLRLDDALYREIINQVCPGKRSAADLDARERGKLLDHFKHHSFRDNRPAPPPGQPDFATPAGPQTAKVRALWADLAARGLLRDPSEAALRSFVKRQTGKLALQWLSAADAIKVIEGLKAILSRGSANA